MLIEIAKRIVQSAPPPEGAILAQNMTFGKQLSRKMTPATLAVAVVCTLGLAFNIWMALRPVPAVSSPATISVNQRNPGTEEFILSIGISATNKKPTTE
jgi:hypothetical protein